MAGRGRPFTKGHDPRRSKATPTSVAKIRELARSACPEAMEAVKQIALDRKTANRDRLTAARLLLEYGVGRPTTYVATDPEQPLQLSVDQQLLELFSRLAHGADGDAE